MGIDEIISQSQAVYTALSEGKFIEAWRNTNPIQITCQDMFLKMGFKSKAPCSEKQKAELKAVWGDIAKVSEEKHSAFCAAEAEGPEAVGKLFPGDGSFIKGLAELLKALAPLVPLFFV